MNSGPQILAAAFFLLMCSPVFWGGWKMLANHFYYKRFRQEQDDILADPDQRRRIERLLAHGSPNAPY